MSPRREKEKDEEVVYSEPSEHEGALVQITPHPWSGEKIRIQSVTDDEFEELQRDGIPVEQFSSDNP